MASHDRHHAYDFPGGHWQCQLSLEPSLSSLYRHVWLGRKPSKQPIIMTSLSVWTSTTANSLVSTDPPLFDLALLLMLLVGTLVELWSVMNPHLTRLSLLILSVGSMVELAELEVGSTCVPSFPSLCNTVLGDA
jgi:hypothetical protein